MLTKKQYDLLMLIHERIRRDGIPPSFEEMKAALGLKSKSGVHRLMTALEERGFIRRLAHRARAVEITRFPENFATEKAPIQRNFRPSVVQGGRGVSVREGRNCSPDGHPVETEETITIPLIGRIAAGTPIEAIENGAARMSIPSVMLSKSGEHFALRVKGDSMVDAGILEGDVVVVRKQPDAENGDIVVALIEDHEATLKKLRRKDDAIALEAANPAYETRVYRDDQIRIQGRMVGLIRTC